MRYNLIDMLPQRAFLVVGGRMTLEGGGKGDAPPPPDYTPMANASKEAAEIGAQLGREQLAENRRQYDQNMEVARPIIDKQAELMDQTKAQGDDYYNYNKSTFRPIEESLAEEAESGTSRYDTNTGVRTNVEQEASRAAADVASAGANADAQGERALLSMGVNPNSGKFAAMKVGLGLTKAAMKAGAQTNARQKAVAMDYAKRLDITGMGRGLPGASQGAYGIALNAGNSAVGNQNATSGQYIQGMNAGSSTIMQGQGLRVQGLGSILNSQTQMYGIGQQAAAADAQGQGQMAGLAVSAAIAI